MAGAATASAWALGAVLVWAAVRKAAHPRATARGFSGLGLPAPAVLAVAVPVAEGATAAALVVRPATGAVIALALLGLFTVVLVQIIRSGSHAGCACFGAGNDEPVRAWTVFRNGMLMALAVVATGASRPVRPDARTLALATAALAAGIVVLHRAQRRSG